MITRYLHFLILLISFLISSCHSSESTTEINEDSRIINSTFINPKIIRDKKYQVLLPKNYANNKSKHYPVLYMMDAQNLFVDSLAYGGFSWRLDRVVDSLVDKSILEEVIIVALENAGVNRFSEYMPRKPMIKIPQTIADSITQNFKRPVYSDNFLIFLTQHLKPIIDQDFRTKPDVKNTFIGGSSMGGLISMYAVCEYPEVFGGAMCLSTHWIVGFDDSISEAPKALVSYFSKNIPEGKKWYFDFGTKGLDQYYEPWQSQIDSILAKNNYIQNQNWITQKYEGHDHNERFWNARLDVPLKFILGK
ncbi:MAG: alpha/beta hydrolase [Saprospiraceae bacterium]